MKCKVFKIHLENDSGETELNEFLENVTLTQTFASVVSEESHFWSVLVFYEDKKALSIEKSPNFGTIENSQNVNALKSETSRPIAQKKEITKTDTAPEAIKLSAEQENSYNALRNWRNERAGQDGVPPYLIAHNDSLMQMATLNIETHEDLLQVKGLGEKRVQKYGDEILKILSEHKQ